MSKRKKFLHSNGDYVRYAAITGASLIDPINHRRMDVHTVAKTYKLNDSVVINSLINFLEKEEEEVAD